VLKEGLSEDPGNRERILPLLRFASTASDADDETVSPRRLHRAHETRPGAHLLRDRREHAAARGSPHIELLRKKGVEVLLLADRIDEW